MIKSCEICNRLIEKKTKKTIGKCEFSDSIPVDLKEEFAQYCDFFSCKNSESN